MQISRMNIEDLKKIEEILEEEFDNFWSYNILSEEILKKDTIYVVAKEGEKILGFAGIWIAPDDVQINNVVVRKNERKKGIGTLLLEKIIKEAEKTDKKEIFLEVNENNFYAIKLYEKFKFEKIGERKKYYNGKDTAIIMRKNI